MIVKWEQGFGIWEPINRDMLIAEGYHQACWLARDEEGNYNPIISNY